jgi:hypothetical protein
VLLDSGSSLTEAALLLLRHADKKTTERRYARAMQERVPDRALRDVQIDRERVCLSGWTPCGRRGFRRSRP